MGSGGDVASTKTRGSTLKNDRINLAGLWGLMREDRGTFSLALASLVVAACLLYLVPLIPQAVIDGVLGDEPERITDASRRLIDWTSCTLS